MLGHIWFVKLQCSAISAIFFCLISSPYSSPYSSPCLFVFPLYDSSSGFRLCMVTGTKVIYLLRQLHMCFPVVTDVYSMLSFWSSIYCEQHKNVLFGVIGSSVPISNKMKKASLQYPKIALWITQGERKEKPEYNVKAKKKNNTDKEKGRLQWFPAKQH